MFSALFFNKGRGNFLNMLALMLIPFSLLAHFWMSFPWEGHAVLSQWNGDGPVLYCIHVQYIKWPQFLHRGFVLGCLFSPVSPPLHCAGAAINWEPSYCGWQSSKTFFAFISAMKSKLSTIASVHVYSIQKAMLKDSGPLYNTDYDIIKANFQNCSKWVLS